MSHSQSVSDLDVITQLWLAALLELDATLPHPVADAMVRNITREPLGETLRYLDQALMHLESLGLDDLTGCEARTVLTVLIAMGRRVSGLQSKISQLANPLAVCTTADAHTFISIQDGNNDVTMCRQDCAAQPEPSVTSSFAFGRFSPRAH